MKLLNFLPIILLVAGCQSHAMNKQGESGTVIKVADGDTLTVMMNGQKERIRLCGIDAPEKAQPLGRESGAMLTRLALGKEVIVYGVERDRYGRMVGEVFVINGDREQFVNADLVQAGMAYHYDRYSKNCPNREVIAVAQAQAQEKHAGVWAAPRSIKPWDYRKER